jgi:hypothetical protein
MKKIVLVLAFLSSFVLMSNRYEVKRITPDLLEVCIGHLKEKPIHLTYSEFHPKLEFENLVFLCDEGKYGMKNCDSKPRTLGIFMRALRFSNMTKAVEEKYELPENTLLVMLMQESNGINYLPNGQNDGGIGLIHMQPAIAHQFGLSTLGGCTDLVCRHHGHQLRKLVDNFITNPEQLFQYDDRFHPMLNIDAAGRMIKYYSELDRIGTTKWESAFKRYAGKYNYPEYTRNLRYYRDYLKDPEFMKEVEDTFNDLNVNLTYCDQPIDFKEFIRLNHDFNHNYELERYKTASFLRP